MTNPNAPRKRRWGLGLAALVALVLVVILVGVLRGGPPPPTVGQGPAPTKATTPAPPAKPAGCPDVQALFVPGTYETNPQADPAVPVGLLAGVGEQLSGHFKGQPSRVSTYFVPYLAQFNNPTPYFVSEQDGVRAASAAMAATAKRCPDADFVLLGFSQGAASAGDLATQIGQGSGPVAAAKLLGVGLVADPNRNPNTEKLIGPAVVGAGLAGPRPKDFGAVGGRVVTFCAPGDLICAIPASSANLANLPATLALVGQYLQSGVHSSYRTYQVAPGESATQWLANWVVDTVDAVPRG